ncbi:ArsI/CadI family heavy metal resistance metalloenzyme [Methylophaga sp. OBS4]|uniref:ArsI/CadI family heavy metal resistance metalloenzyme n=1 Tax=Methylophaga sp. OBS4 TaxID=2991935 RepID=UPI00225B2684|nr:ArsI/CadI family heavy metal resistance metalloenzyme [Methylophaga sp. OBS4]MCX4188016.1 VOC family protein [Methylophaga sp. OBS4]
MKRMHIHVGVEDIAQSVKFYTALFGAEPAKTMPDYAKWMLDDPRINFAISTRAGKKGVDHLGFQVDSDVELDEIRERINAADIKVIDEGETVCCYAESDKSWVLDPAGIAWEAYQTMGEAQMFSAKEASQDSACCVPLVVDNTACCEPSDTNTGCCG